MQFAVREATIERKTKETDVFVKINLDGTGICKANSGIPFLDHMLDVSTLHLPTLMSTQNVSQVPHRPHDGSTFTRKASVLCPEPSRPKSFFVLPDVFVGHAVIDRGWFGAQQLSSHGLFDITVEAHGDTHIDDHHTNEDIALALGTVRYLLLRHPFARDCKQSLLHYWLGCTFLGSWSYSIWLPYHST